MSDSNSGSDLKIIEFKAENVKRIKVVQIFPEGNNAVVIAGKNSQGKSSVLDSIWLALQVSEANKVVNMPIHEGADKAKSYIDLGTIKVTRTFTQKGTYLKVEPKELVTKYGGAQAVLDAFIGELSFDPCEFLKLSSVKKREKLLKLVPLTINLDTWEAIRKVTFTERADSNKKVKEFELLTAKYPAIPDDTPDTEIDIQALITDVQNTNERVEDHTKALSRIEEIQQKIAALEVESGNLSVFIRTCTPESLDIVTLREKLNKSELINTNVRTLQTYNENLTELDGHKGTSQALSDKLDKLDQEKQDAIKAAKFPIDGLGFDSTGVTFNNIPLSSEVDSLGIKISMSIAMAFNPKLKVILIKDGSLLDDDNFALVKQIAKEKGYQLWIERVGDADGSEIIIEDGEIKGSENSMNSILDKTKDIPYKNSVPDDAIISSPVPDPDDDKKGGVSGFF